MWKNLARDGFKSYGEYFESGRWREKAAEYSRSNLPQNCLVCHHHQFRLYHRTFTRIGNEFLLDLVPLCGKCHGKIMGYLRRENIRDVYKQKIDPETVQETFGFAREKVVGLFEPVSICRKSLRFFPKNADELERARKIIGPAAVSRMNLPALFPWYREKRDTEAEIALRYARDNSEFRQGKYGTELWMFDDKVGDYVFCVTMLVRPEDVRENIVGSDTNYKQ